MRKINSQLPVAAGRVLLRHLEAHFPAIAQKAPGHRHTRHTFITNQDNQFFTTVDHTIPPHSVVDFASLPPPTHSTTQMPLLFSPPLFSPFP